MQRFVVSLAWCAVSACVLLLAQTVDAAEGTNGAPTIEQLTREAERRDGLMPVFVDRAAGKLWLSLPKPSEADGEVGRFLHTVGLAAGLGSNPVGLDRGLLGPTRLVVLRLLGNRLLVEQVNLGFRALTDDRDERRAVEESFARSVLWAGEVAATGENGRSIVDISSFAVRDALGVARQLDDAGQGHFHFDAGRSAIDFDRTLSFPDNLEFEAVLTWTTAEPGAHVREVAPDPHALTLSQHQSLLRLPDDDYLPRRFDPRAGSFAVEFKNYAAPLDRPVDEAWIVRHRLRKTHPERERSDVEEPIVYYLDRGVPEPVRSALLDGARWWEKAFEAAGFIDAFRVELLPEGVHLLDARYNVIEWVHRSSRGWSNGDGIVDPRTGEMIKGHVRLGSLRVRQDRLLFEGLAGTGATGSGKPDDPIELALARIRQLSAHEVGHTLGFAHNFAASTYADRASVMDYPAPRVRIDGEGNLDFSDAYGVGVGVWDRLAVEYAYGEFPPGANEEAELASIVDRAIERGWIFLTDADARPDGAAQPLANLWDNGANPVAELVQTMAVRRIALDRFGKRNIREGEPLAALEEVLVPVYLYHRYQLEAAVKSIGGLYYAYAIRGDANSPAAPVDAARQREALEVVLSTLDPAALEIVPRIAALILPRPPGSPPGREQFAGSTAPVFDPKAAAETAAEMTISALLQPERAARLINFHESDPSLPSFESVLSALVDRVFSAPASSGSGELRSAVRRVLVGQLILNASAPGTPDAVRVRLDDALSEVADRLQPDETPDAEQRFLIERIARYRQRPAPVVELGPPAFPAPPGSPIGSPGQGHLGACSHADGETHR